MGMTVTSAVLDSLLAEAQAAFPRECCGLLFGSDEAIDAHRPAANVHPSPETHFEIDPQALIDVQRSMRSGGPRLIGYYHSHPSGPPAPSATDLASAPGDGMIWAIVGEGRVALWRVHCSGFAPVPID